MEKAKINLEKLKGWAPHLPGLVLPEPGFSRQSYKVAPPKPGAKGATDGDNPSSIGVILDRHLFYVDNARVAPELEIFLEKIWKSQRPRLVRQKSPLFRGLGLSALETWGLGFRGEGLIKKPKLFQVLVYRDPYMMYLYYEKEPETLL